MLTRNLNNIIEKNQLNKLVSEPTDSYYDHTTFTIHSLSEFVLLIESLTELYKKFPYYSFVYRGMSDYRWILTPSLERKISETKHGSDIEHSLAVEFSSEFPTLFQNTDSHFIKIAKMQHFGIPTRLLDFTLNPLISLFFACSDHSRTAGRIAFTLSKIHYYDDPCVECSSSLYLYDDCLNIKLDDLILPYKIPVSNYLFHTYANHYDTSPLFVKPLYLDDRMKVQRSVFLLFHNCIRDIADNNYYEKNIDHNNQFQFENLEDIYQEQIDNPFLFWGDRPFFIVNKTSFKKLTDTYRKLEINKFWEQIETAFSNRFYLQPFIDPIEMPDIWFNFASIIIPSECKKIIINQLKHIGIDEAYVYPEAEHMANRIKNQYR
ncbi:MAG: FRG domain-containing protein [Lachnospiraceae bacterium]|nr:FRG domain-containing protein [Lachnospiraceae bacterium]